MTRVIGRSRTARLAGLPLLALLPTCMAHMPPCPAAGGPTWTEVEGAHFRVRTDKDAAGARAVLADLEEFQAALLHVFAAPPDLDFGKLPVVAVDRGWTDFAPSQVAGYFTHALFQPLIVMNAESDLHQRTVVKHELVHYLSDKVIPHQPRWLAEGLATYYETLEYDADAGRITVGRPALGRMRTAQHTSVATFEAMFAATNVGGDGAYRFYAAAWITMHYLMNHRAVALTGYQAALRAGATPEAAWTAAFGAQTPAQLAQAVQEHAVGGQYEILIYQFPRPGLAAPVERRLPDADTHATRALLFLSGGVARRVGPPLSDDDPRVIARHEVDEALRQEPAHVGASAIAHWLLGAPVDRARATAATQANGGDWLAWLLLADALGRDHDAAGRADALARAAELARADRSVTLDDKVTSTEHPPH